MAEETPKTTPPPAAPATAEGEHQPADLMTRARTIAETVQAAATHQTDKISKAKAAEAAENVLEAAKNTAKLDDKSGLGQYVDKAQDYLHQMHSGDAGKEEKEKEKDKEKESGDVATGGFMKMAQGFFK